LRAIVFIDFENFDIAKKQYYKTKALREAQSLAQTTYNIIKFVEKLLVPGDVTQEA
jgi:hypothetical protein